MKRVLIFRFSSLGDVAMTVPVIKILLQTYANLEVTVVSTEFVRPLFNNIDRLHFFAADLKGKHKGIPGLFKLYKELKRKNHFDAIADLHNVIRTKILRTFFAPSKKNIGVIDKGRKEKKELTREVNKKLRPLKSTFQRYADVFASIHLPVELGREAGIKAAVNNQLIDEVKWNGYRVIGMAPFALHHEKTYPAEKMKHVLHLLGQHKVKLFLFGGKKEQEILDRWENEFEHVESLACKMNFENELSFISNLDLMVSMDSANMHFASLFGVPVVSVWGGTHPYLGFYGWGQAMENAVQVDLECRPSSVFGNKPCPRGDTACMNLISPFMIYEKIVQQLKL